MERKKDIWPPLIVFIGFIAFWQFGINALGVPNYLVPKPTDIYDAALSNFDLLMASVFRTVTESVLGFGLSAIIGIGGAMMLASSKILERSLYPYAIVLQTIPVVAIAPIIVIWFGSGFNAIVIISFIISFFPMVTNTLIGLNSVDKNMHNLFSLYGANKWNTMWKLRLPAALPYIMGGLKISCTLAVVGAIVGEYIAGIGGGEGGLGYSITVASVRLQTAYLFACGLSAAILGMIFFFIVNMTSKMMLSSWHESEMKQEG